MKTSFYFFLWFIVYWLIDLTGVPMLIQNGFIVALIFVWIVSRLDRQWFAAEKQYQHNLNMAYIYEIFYTKDSGKMASILRDRLVWQVIWTVYCILTVLSVVLFRLSDSLFALFVFGIIGIATMVASVNTFKQYVRVKEHGLPHFEESEYARYATQYQYYCDMRRSYTYRQLQPPIPRLSKWVNIASIIFAVICILGGGFYLFNIFMSGGILNVALSALMIWGVLAIYFGVKDLIDSIKLLQGKPVPTLKTF